MFTSIKPKPLTKQNATAQSVSPRPFELDLYSNSPTPLPKNIHSPHMFSDVSKSPQNPAECPEFVVAEVEIIRDTCLGIMVFKAKRSLTTSDLHNFVTEHMRQSGAQSSTTEA